MEEDPKPAQDPPTQNPNPDPNPNRNPNPDPAPNTTPVLHPQPAQQPSPPPPPPSIHLETKKRPLDSRVQIQECSYFKMRAVLKDIRPHIFEMLRAADFRSCTGSHELQERLKLLMELYKQMTSETVTMTKLKSAHGRPNGVPFANPSENKPFQLGIPSEKLQAEHGDGQGTHIVGGSAFGWNFITFGGSKPIYYGRTKESFRAAQVTP